MKNLRVVPFLLVLVISFMQNEVLAHDVEYGVSFKGEKEQAFYVTVADCGAGKLNVTTMPKGGEEIVCEAQAVDTHQNEKVGDWYDITYGNEKVKAIDLLNYIMQNSDFELTQFIGGNIWFRSAPSLKEPDEGGVYHPVFNLKTVSPGGEQIILTGVIFEPDSAQPMIETEMTLKVNNQGFLDEMGDMFSTGTMVQAKRKVNK